MKIKLTLIGCREWNKPGNESTGQEDIHCFFYAGYDENSKPIEFKSNKGNYKVHDVLKYDQALAQEFDLKSTFDSFKGKIKFSEVEVA